MCQWLSAAVFHHLKKSYQEGTFTLFRVLSTIWKLYLFIYYFLLSHRFERRPLWWIQIQQRVTDSGQILIVLCIYVKCEINLWILCFIVTDSVLIQYAVHYINIFTPHSINLIPHLKQTVGQLSVLEKLQMDLTVIVLLIAFYSAATRATAWWSIFAQKSLLPDPHSPFYDQLMC